MPLCNSKPDAISSDSFNDLFLKYYTYIYAIVYRIIQDRVLSEDIVQDVFLALVQSRVRFADENAAKAWIITVARNRAINFTRDQHMEETRLTELEAYEELADEDENPLQIVVDREAVAYIYHEMTKLDQRYSDILLLKYKFQYEISEIAALLSLPPKTVYTRYERGRSRLKERLAEKQKGGEADEGDIL